MPPPTKNVQPGVPKFHLVVSATCAKHGFDIDTTREKRKKIKRLYCSTSSRPLCDAFVEYWSDGGHVAELSMQVLLLSIKYRYCESRTLVDFSEPGRDCRP